MASEMREELAKHLGHRLTVRGLVGEVRVDEQGSRACVKDPEAGDRVLCSHVWVLGIGEEWTDKEGSQVKFDAVVRDYTNEGGRNYCLRNPANLAVVSPPAFRYAAGENGAAEAPKRRLRPRQGDKVPDLPSVPAAVPEPPKPPPEAPRSPVDDLRAAKAFAKQCGGAASALGVLDGLPAMPTALLREYLAVLAEE